MVAAPLWGTTRTRAALAAIRVVSTVASVGIWPRAARAASALQGPEVPGEGGSAPACPPPAPGDPPTVPPLDAPLPGLPPITPPLGGSALVRSSPPAHPLTTSEPKTTTADIFAMGALRSTRARHAPARRLSASTSPLAIRFPPTTFLGRRMAWSRTRAKPYNTATRVQPFAVWRLPARLSACGSKGYPNPPVAPIAFALSLVSHAP